MESTKVFFDINIVLDIIDPMRSHHSKAKELWKILVTNKSQILISEDMLSTIFYINSDNKYTLEFFQIIQKRWQIVPFGKNVINNAIDLSIKNNLDLEDVLQCLCAQENGCAVFITNDNNFYDCGMSIQNVDDFLLSPLR
ncbi:MAG: type II toxin-antitoxin system VapC family toxin [Gammaproteobacteria bacterium]|jgi:predicted nucleic acid-binding protein|nr:type II toxin-antitoxin system VapC family toxin [Gammaproteobacteria bacterium]MBT4861143.1 type II toxin-antitoxin system VapC family toxin [Gammaproteobacteria bacterium]